MAVERSQHHVGGVQRVDEVGWERILLFDCVRPPEKGQKSPNVSTALGSCSLMRSNMKRGLPWNRLRSKVASLPAVQLTPSETVSKTILGLCTLCAA